MPQKLLVAVAALIVLGAAGAGGWWFAAEKGLIPGRPNSPRPENFKAALDAHLARTIRNYNRPCAPVDTSRPQDGMGPKDIRFDWTPASFRMVLDPRRPPPRNTARRYAYLAGQGFFAAKALPEEAIEYTLTWKGMAAASGQGCFIMAESRRNAEVLSFAKKRTENGVDIYEVVARPLLASVEEWAKTPEFREAFADTQVLRHLEPQPVAYELARGEQGFEVIAEAGRSLIAQPVVSMRGAVVAKLAGSVTNERVQAALEAYLGAQQGAQQARICLNPPQPHEADENTLDGLRTPRPGTDAAPVTYVIYNLLQRGVRQPQDPLRGYLALRKFEALGFATSEAIPAAEFRGQAAAGAVRFVLSPAYLERYARERCYQVAAAQVDGIVRVDPLTDTNLTPQFLARVKPKPWDAEAGKAIEAFPHLARLQEVGAVVRGTLQFHDNELRVVSVHAQYPLYHPDTSEVRLPVVESAPVAIAPGKPAATAGGALFEARSAGMAGAGAMDIVVREVERRARSSVVQVDVRKAGSSVGSSFFVVCSLRKLAQQRGNTRHVVKLEDRPRRGQMLVGFLRSPGEPPASVDPAFAGAGPAAQVMALEQFAQLCDKMK